MRKAVALKDSLELRREIQRGTARAGQRAMQEYTAEQNAWHYEVEQATARGERPRQRTARELWRSIRPDTRSAIKGAIVLIVGFFVLCALIDPAYFGI